MKKIGFLTAEIFPNLIDDDLAVFPFLKERGIDGQAVVWDLVTDQELKQFDAFVFRSCWNYHEKYPEFKKFLQRLKATNIPVHNPIDLVVWNLNKKHIIEYEGKILVPKTQYFELGFVITETELQKIIKSWSADFLVLKPAVSLNGFETFLMSTANNQAIINKFNSLLSERDMLIQEYVPEIKTTGEVSLIYFNGKFSHAIRKLAAVGEFRIHQEHGGTRQPMQPSQQALEYGDQVLQHMNRDLLYARVDFVESENGPMLIEIEVTDPMLFLLTDVKAPQRFADALKETIVR